MQTVGSRVLRCSPADFDVSSDYCGERAGWFDASTAHLIVLVKSRWLRTIDADLDAGSLPDLDKLARHFAPRPTAIPDISVEVAPLHLYDELSTVQLVGGWCGM